MKRTLQFLLLAVLTLSFAKSNAQCASGSIPWNYDLATATTFTETFTPAATGTQVVILNPSGGGVDGSDIQMQIDGEGSVQFKFNSRLHYYNSLPARNLNGYNDVAYNGFTLHHNEKYYAPTTAGYSSNDYDQGFKIKNKSISQVKGTGTINDPWRVKLEYYADTDKNDGSSYNASKDILITEIVSYVDGFKFVRRDRQITNPTLKPAKFFDLRDAAFNGKYDRGYGVYATNGIENSTSGNDAKVNTSINFIGISSESLKVVRPNSNPVLLGLIKITPWTHWFVDEYNRYQGETGIDGNRCDSNFGDQDVSNNYEQSLFNITGSVPDNLSNYITAKTCDIGFGVQYADVGNGTHYISVYEVVTIPCISEIAAVDDNFNVEKGGTTTSVLINDKDGLGNSPATQGNTDGVHVNLANGFTNTAGEVLATQPTGFTLNADGTIVVGENAPTGKTVLHYKICLETAKIECQTAKVIIDVKTNLKANDDTYKVRAGSLTTSVLLNDVDGAKRTPAQIGNTVAKDIQLTNGFTDASGNLLATQPTGFTLNSDGTIAVAIIAPIGVKDLYYKICVVGGQEECAVAKATLNVICAAGEVAPSVGTTVKEINNGGNIDLTAAFSVAPAPSGSTIKWYQDVALTQGVDSSQTVSASQKDFWVVYDDAEHGCKSPAMKVTVKTSLAEEVKVNKIAEKVAGSPNEWKVKLSIQGANVNEKSDVVLLIDNSGSMAQGQRLSKTKEAAKLFVDKLIKDNTGVTRVAIYTFSDNVVQLSGFSTNKVSLKAKIDAIPLPPTSSSTFTQGALHKAKELLKNSLGSNKNIVLLSDGSPSKAYEAINPSAYFQKVSSDPNKCIMLELDFKGHEDVTKVGIPSSGYNYNSIVRGPFVYNIGGSASKLQNLGNSAIDEANFAKLEVQNLNIYTVGLELGITSCSNGHNVGKDILGKIASASSTSYFADSVDASSTTLNDIFTAISGKILEAVSEGEVVDIIGRDFVIPGIDETNYETKINVTHGTISYDNTTRKITWSVGKVSKYETAEMSYNVVYEDLAGETATGDTNGYDTNDSAKLKYTDSNGSTTIKTFPKPKVKPEYGTIQKIYYRVNAAGNPINLSGTVVNKEDAAAELQPLEYYFTAGGGNISPKWLKIDLSQLKTEISVSGPSKTRIDKDGKVYLFTKVADSDPKENIIKSLEWRVPFNKVYFAYKEATARKVTYNINGATGTTPTDNSDYYVGDEVTVAQNTGFTKAGYSFTGWKTSQAGNAVYQAGNTFTMPDENVTLTAQWEANNQILTYDGNGNTAGVMSTETRKTDAVFNLTKNEFTKAGYTFNGWNTAANGSGTSYNNGVSYTMPAQNTTIYAQWTANANTAYTVEHHFQNLAGTYVKDNAKTETKAGTTDEQTSATALTVTGFTVVTPITQEVIKGNGTTVIIVKYNRNDYNVKYAYTGTTPTGVPNAPATETKKFEESVTIAAKPTLTNYTFFGWKNGTADATNFSMPANNVTLTGEWKKNVVDTDPNDPAYVKITFNSGTNGKFTDGTTTKTVWALKDKNIPFSQVATAVGVKATDATGLTPDAGYSFNKWNPAFPTIVGSTGGTYTAEYKPNGGIAYKVEHYKQKADGTYPTVANDTDNLTGTTGETVTATPKTTYTGYTYDATTSTASGTVLGDGSLVLKLYYKANDITVTDPYAGGSLPDGTVGETYGPTTAPTVANGSGTYKFTTPDLPSGLTMNPDTGVVTGTPTVAVKDKPVTVTVTDAVTGKSVTYTTSITVRDRVIPVDPTDPTPSNYVRVTFNKGNHGTLVKGTKDTVGKFAFDVVKGAAYSELADYKPSVTPSTGYTFKVFNEKADGTGADYPTDLTTKITTNKDYTARYFIQLTFNANGGSFSTTTAEPTNVVTVEEGKTPLASDIKEPVRDAYCFLGWSKSSGANLPDTPAIDFTKPINQTAIYYAVWAKDPTLTAPANFEIIERKAVTIDKTTFTGTDLNNVASYSIVGLINGLTFNEGALNITGTPNVTWNDGTGKQYSHSSDIKLTATTKCGKKITAEFTITVLRDENNNDIPDVYEEKVTFVAEMGGTLVAKPSQVQSGDKFVYKIYHKDEYATLTWATLLKPTPTPIARWSFYKWMVSGIPNTDVADADPVKSQYRAFFLQNIVNEEDPNNPIPDGYSDARIIFDGDGGDLTPKYSGHKLAADKKLYFNVVEGTDYKEVSTIKPTAKKFGHNFKAWSPVIPADGQKVTSTSEKVFKATYTPKPPVVDTDPNDPEYVEVNFAVENGSFTNTQQTTKVWALIGTTAKTIFDFVQLKTTDATNLTANTGYSFKEYTNKAGNKVSDVDTVTTPETFTAKFIKNIIPVDPTDPTPSNYVRVTFNKGNHGTLVRGAKDTVGKFAFDVLKDVAVDFTGYEPIIKPNAGYTAKTDKWLPAIKISYTKAETHVAQYNKNVVPVDPTDPSTGDDYVRVTFTTDANGTLTPHADASGKTVFDVVKGTEFSEVLAVVPTAEGNTGYTFDDWNPVLPAGTSTVDVGATYTAKYNKNVVPVDPTDPPTGDDYVRVTFTTDANGTLTPHTNANGKVVFDVVKGTEFSEVLAVVPTAKGNTGYTFDNWNPELPAGTSKVNAGATYTAKYNKNVVPVDPSDPPTGDDYVRVTFTTDANGTLTPHADASGKTVFDVVKGTEFSEVLAVVPTAKGNTGYTFDDWNPVLPAGTSKVNAGATYTAKYNKNVVPVDPTDPPTGDDYVRVTFTTDANGTLTPHADANGKVVFDVVKGTAFSEVLAVVPTAKGNTGYTFDNWNPELPAGTSKVNAGATYTAKYNKNVVPVDPTDPPTGDDYVRVTFTTDANGTLTPHADASGNTVFDVVKGTEFSEVLAVVPTAKGNTGYTFDDWDPVLPTGTSKVNAEVTYTAKYNKNVVPVDPTDPPTGDNYVRVTFASDAEGTLTPHTNASGKTVFDVVKGTEFSEVLVVVPAAKGNTGYTFDDWNPVLPAGTSKVNAGATYTAKYNKNVVPVDPTDPPTGDDYVRVTFTTDANGTLTPHADASGKTVFDVVKGTEFSEVLAVVPTAKGNTGYTFDDWDPVLPAGMSKVNAEATYTAKYNKNVVPVDPTDPPTGDDYVRVTFTSDAEGTLTPHTDANGKVVFDVVKGTEFSEVLAVVPTAVGNTGYTFKDWDPTLPASTTAVTLGATYTAKYNKNVIPVDPNDPVKDGYVRVVFDKGANGILEAGAKDTAGKFAFDVLKNVTVDFTGYEPTIKPNDGYSIATNKWNPAINAKYTVKTTHIAQYTANTNTAYKVEHYKQNTLDATYPTTPSEVETLEGTTDTTVTAVAKTYDGFTVDYNVTGTIKEGVVKGDGSLVLKLYYKDTKAPDNTTTTLTINNVTEDNIINGEEATQNIPVTGTVKGEFKEGDVVTLTVNGKDFTGKVKADGTFSIIVTGSDLAADPDTTIDGKVAATDPAGNVGEATATKKYDVKTDVNGGVAPTVTITEDANNDGFINKEEMSADNLVDIKVEFNKDKVEVGDTITVWLVGSNTKTVKVDATIKANSYITTDFPSTGHGTTMTVKATITDVAGNKTPEGEDSAKIDLSDFNKDGVKIEITSDANNDGFLNIEEFGDGKAITTKVTLPADAVAGDKLLVTLSGATPQEVTLSQGQIDAGFVTSTFDGSSNGDGSVITATAKVTDDAGNESDIAKDEATVKFNTLLAPTVTIVEDNNPDDGWLNKEELNGATEVTAKVELPTGTVAGDKVIVSDNAGNKHEIPVTPTDVTNGYVTQKFPTPAEGQEIVVEAYVVNKVGNPSDKGSDKAIVDTSDLNGVAITITTDTNNDNIINKAELAADVNKVKVEVKLPVNAKAGDNIIIKMTGNVDINRALTSAEISAGKINVEYSPANNGIDMIATAQVIDSAKNKSNVAKDNAVIDTTEPGAPTVVITQDTNGDGRINATEKGTDVAVKITPPDTAKVGDTLEVTDNAGNTFTKVLTAEDLTNGVETTFPNPAEGQEIVVEAKVINQAGTPGPKGDAKAILDTTNLNGVTAEIITDANNDKLISAAELEADNNKVKVKVGLPTTAEAGDTLEVTMTDNSTQTITLTAEQIAAKEVIVEFNPAPEGTKMVTTAKVTDIAKNQSNVATDEATIDTKAMSAPGVTIREDNNPDDGYINQAELGNATELTIDITVPAEAEAGDTIKVTDNFGNTKEIVLTQAQVDTKKASTTLPLPADGEEIIVKAQAIDKAGNPSKEGQDKAIIDLTEFKGLAIEITTDANNDGFISAEEFAGKTSIDVRVTVPQGAKEKDVITVTGSSNTDQTVILTKEDIAKGYIDLKFATAPVDGATFTTTAIIEDTAGNTAGPVKDTAEMQLSAPSNPIVKIEDDKNNDGYINAEELDRNNDGIVSPEEFKYIKVSVTLPQKAEEGNLLEVDTNGDGTNDYTKTLTAEDITKGSVAIPNVLNPGEGNTLTVTAIVKDKAGNPSEPGTDSAIIDISVPSAPTVEINDGGDGKLNKEEIAAGVTVTVTPPADAKPGDILKVDTNGDGTPDFEKPLTQGDITNGVTVNVPSEHIPEKGTLTVDATVTDPAGNESPKGTDSSETDNQVPNGGEAPVVEITTDKNNDGFINKEEMEADGVIKVKVSFDGTKVDEGDTVIVVDRTNPAKPVTKEVPVTAKDKANGYITTDFNKPEEGSNIVITATIKDPAGNESKEGKDTAKLDTSDLTTNGGVKIVITNDADNNGLISKEELGNNNTLTSEVTLPENAVVGDKLIVTGTGNSDKEIILTATQVANGKIKVNFNAPANGTEFITTAQVTDPAGNKSNLAEDKATLQLDAPGAPIVTITEDKNNDGYINKEELDGDIDVEVTLPEKAKEGDTLTVEDNEGNTFTKVLTPEDITNGKIPTTFPVPTKGDKIEIKATVTDPAGNKGPEGTASAIIDTSDLVTGLAIEITTDEDNNGLISTKELEKSSNKIVVKVTLPEGAEVGDTLTITGSGNTPQIVVLKQVQVNAGSVEVAFNPLSDGSDFITTATIKDVAGNEGGPVQDQAKMQLSAPGQPVVTIENDKNNDGYISKDELDGEDINVSVTVPATAVVGDTMNIDTNGDGTPDTTKAITLADIQKGNISLTVPNPGEGKEVKVVAWVTDEAGNKGEEGSDSAIIDTLAPGKPTVQIEDGDDGKLTNEEIEAGVKVKVTPPADAQPGDKLEVDTNGDGTPDFTKELTQEDINNGVTVEVPAEHVPEKGTLTVEATVTDAAGNISDKGSDSSEVSRNNAPNAVDDEAFIDSRTDETVVIDVLANDTDPDGNLDSTSVTIVTQPTLGTVTVDPQTGEVTYTIKGTTLGGVDIFTYQVCDTEGACSTAKVEVTVAGVAAECSSIFPGEGNNTYKGFGFSPNGNGYNEKFEIDLLEVCYPNYKMEIYNRYGNKVYEYQHDGDPSKEPIWWDGKSQGRWTVAKNKGVTTGTYFYIIYLNKDGKQPVKGYVYLTR